MTTTIDTTGFSCPQPMLMAKEMMTKQTAGSITVLADCDASRENITRMAKQLGWSVTVEASGDLFTLHLTK